MKKYFQRMVLVAVAVAAAQVAVAESWRVNNDTSKGAHFASINAAMSDSRVADGDTLYLDPGTYITASQTISKRVTVVGPGYFLARLGMPYGEAQLTADLYIKAAGVKIEGCWTEVIQLGGDNITIERCRVAQIRYWTSSASTRNAVIHANFISSGYTPISGSSSTSQNTTGWIITNNIMCQLSTGSYNRSVICDLAQATIMNNVIENLDSQGLGISRITNSIITNNIFANTSAAAYSRVETSSSEGNTIEYNVFGCADTDMPLYTTNNIFLNSTDRTTIFTTTEPDDRFFQLCEGSPAKGAGMNGVDCGPFAEDSYVLSGLPLHYPYFTNVMVPGYTTDGKISIKLNIQTQDE